MTHENKGDNFNVPISRLKSSSSEQIDDLICMHVVVLVKQ